MNTDQDEAAKCIEAPVDLQAQAAGAMLLVSAAVGAIGKNRKAAEQMGGFAFRGVDDVLGALHEPLIEAGLVIVPRVIDVRMTERPGGSFPDGSPKPSQWHALVLVEYRFIHESGGVVVVGPIPGEGLDNRDKAIPKALSLAYKMMAFETFCIPVDDASVDAEADAGPPEPQSGAAWPGRQDMARGASAGPTAELGCGHSRPAGSGANVGGLLLCPTCRTKAEVLSIS